MSLAAAPQDSSAIAREPNARQFAFLFTDLVNSTGLKAQLNSWKYVCNVLEPHDDLFRRLLSQYANAYEIKHLGDGFLAIFTDVRDAVAFSLRFHAAISEYPWQLDRPDQRVLTRIGIDIGFAVVKMVDETPVDVFGPSVDLASRVMSAADGGRTLMTITAFEIARPALTFIEMNLERAGIQRTPVRLVRHGEYRIQGVEERVVLCEACLNDVEPVAPRSNPPKVINVVDEWWQPETAPDVINPLDVPDRPGWKLVRKLGEGGFGAAYLATDSHDGGTDRVFKFCRTLERLDALRNELDLLKQLRHLKRDDIVAYLGAHLDRPPYFLEFEFVAGGNLLEWAQQQGGLQQVDLVTRLEVFAKIAGGVAAAHRERVFHLDLKPSNILMERARDGSWQPKITDFGIGAREVDGQVSRTRTPANTNTKSTSRESSTYNSRHLYVPPEAADQTYSGASRPVPAANLDVRDVYALGVLLFQFAVGDLQRPLAPSAIRLVSPKLLREDIEQATHFDPRQRLSSAAELEQRIRSLKSRERRRFLVRSFVPAVASLLLGLLVTSATCAVMYRLYAATLAAKEEAVAAREEADDARREVERQYQEKLKAITGFWRDIDGDEDLAPHKDFPNEVQQVQLLREIRVWLLEQAEQDLAQLQPNSDNIDNQITYARLTLRISQLLDDEKLDVRQRRLESGLASLEPAIKAHPDHPGLRLLLSDFENQLGQVEYESGAATALGHFENCLKIRRKLLDDSRAAGSQFPLPDWEYDRKMLASLHNLGLMRLSLAAQPANQGPKAARTLSAEAENHAAIVQLQEALEGRSRLAAEVAPASAAVLRDLASSQFTFGRLFRGRANEDYAQGRSADAKEWVALSREFYASALKSFQASQQLEASTVTRQRLVESLRELVDLEMEQGNFTTASEYRDEMVQQVALVLPSTVRDLNARVYFTDAKYSLRKYRSDKRAEDLPLAKADLRLAEHLYLTLVKLDADNLRLWGDLGVVQFDLGSLLLESKEVRERVEAAEKLRSALEAWDLVKQRAPAQFERLFSDNYRAAEADLEVLLSDPALRKTSDL